MLTELSIRNFAIIDDISISFNEGLTVLTGETGAGKSIIIDAVQLLAGERASVEFIRHGAEKAEIIGLFDVTKEIKVIASHCDNYGIDQTEDNMIVLERTITNRGKSICRINGKIVTLSILRKFGDLLVNIHSQHDNIHLMNPNTHIQLLDLYNQRTITPLKLQYTKHYNKLRILQEKYDQLNENEQQMAHRLDLLEFQLNEINEASLKENEDEQLMTERKLLQNYESIHQAIETAYDALYGEGKALEWIDIARKAFQDNNLNESELIKQGEQLDTLFFTLEEVTFDIRSYSDTLYYDENRLNDIEARLDLISQLKRKYGQTVNEIIAYKNKIAIEIDEIKNREHHNEQLSKQIQTEKSNAISIGKKLTKERKKTSQKLMTDIKNELADLYLEQTTFAVQFNENPDELLNINGLDDVSFMLSTNIGEPLKPLNRIASGGEISRIMLALKKIFAKHDKILTVIFDEIDTGVSGRVAQSIAEKMYEISTNTQVLCITHLPQVAAMSDHHVLILKEEKNNRTTTSTKKLTNDEKVNELSKMITGSELTKTAIEHSHQMLELTEQFKNEIS